MRQATQPSVHDDGHRLSLLWACLFILLIWLFSPAPRAAGDRIVSFDDARYDDQYYIQPMRFEQAWGRLANQPRSHRVTVAVLDTGFDTSHRDLRGVFLNGYNVIDGNSNVAPVASHGTAVAGTIAAISGNGTGTAGLAGDARILPIRITNQSNGSTYASIMAAGIRAAADRGARVINLSYTGANYQVIQDAAMYAQRRGAILFMAAGNDGMQRDRWINHKQIMVIGSVDQDLGVSSFANTGRFLDYVAPGRGILTTQNGGGYKTWTGTSLASPIAASAAALALQANPELLPWQLRVLMRKSAIDLGEKGKDDDFGHGLIDVDRLVELALRTQGRYSLSERLWTLEGSTPTINIGQSALTSRGAILSVSSLHVPEPTTGAIIMVACGFTMLGRRRAGGC